MTQPEKLQGLVAAGSPGAAAWLQDEHGSLQAASGLADLATGRPMRPELHFRAGSVTKSLVAAVVLRLVAEGAVRLPAPTPPRLDPAGADRPGTLLAGSWTVGSSGRWGLRGTCLPTDAHIPSPAARGDSLPCGPSGEVVDGPLLDVTVQDPSPAWAAGGWCPPWRTWPPSSGPCWAAGCCRPGCWPGCGPPSRSRLVPSRSPSTTATA